MVNIVNLQSGRYMVDVGFGGNGAVHPLALKPDMVSPGIGPQEYRLRHTNIASNSSPDQKLWLFQHRNSSDDEWNDAYCFTELEFLPVDYEVMNFWTSQSGKTWFTSTIVAVRMVLDGEDVVGTIILGDDEVKQRIQGKVEQSVKLKTEGERLEALKKWFDITLSEEEKAGIKGMSTQLPET